MAVALGNNTIVTVFGGSGFVGRYVVQALARAGFRIKVAVRRPDLALFLQPLGLVGQIALIQANVRDDASVANAVRGADAVVNLAGILAPSRRQTFRAVHADAAKRIAAAAQAQGASAFTHVSAIGADRVAPSVYARTKGDGEANALAAFPRAVIVRPSLVFGPEDQFFNRFAALARFSPVLPLIGGKTRFQPVYAGDVAQAIVATLTLPVRQGAVYELGGPSVYTFREILQSVCEWTEHSRALLPIPFWAAKLSAFLSQIIPGAPITLDQVRLLQRDNVVSEGALRDNRTLSGLGIREPRSVELIVPGYLQRFRPRGEFSGDRARAA